MLCAWGAQSETARLLSSADGVALVAHLCNAAAKQICESYYQYKPMLVQYAAEIHSFSWHHNGVVYIETVVGQVSFHVFEDETEYLPERESGQWAGGFMQDAAYEMLQAFLAEEDADFERWIIDTQP